MIHGSLHSLQSVVSGSSLKQYAEFSGACTDSRQVAPGQLFIALRGEQFDAHDFLDQVEQAKAAAVVVERVPEGLHLPALVVPDTKEALIQIGRYWRRQFKMPVIGVTGSNGKTTVKEMIAAILKAHFGEDHMIATKGNLNNELGVPMTLMRLDASHQAAVIEMGMNHPGEIALLSSMACPTVALVNNAQREHQEFMQSVEAVAIENGAAIQSLPDDGVAVFPADDAYSALWTSLAQASGHRSIKTFGLNANADVYASYTVQPFGSAIQLHLADKIYPFDLAAAGEHNVLNALAAAACCSAIGVCPETIVRGLSQFHPVAGRLQLKQSSGGARVIDDTYNANPDSVRAAIDVLAKAAHQRVLVLGDMGEVGAEGAQFHREIGQYAKTQGVDRLYTLGSLAEFSSASFGSGAAHYEDIVALLTALNEHRDASHTLLVKGSRFMKMERVVAQLVAAD